MLKRKILYYLVLNIFITMICTSFASNSINTNNSLNTNKKNTKILQEKSGILNLSSTWGDQFHVILQDEYGIPIKDKILSWEGFPYPYTFEQVTSAKTDDEGRATFSYKMYHNDFVPIVYYPIDWYVSFDGDNLYNPSSLMIRAIINNGGGPPIKTQGSQIDTTVIKENPLKMQLTIGSSKALINGVEKELDPERNSKAIIIENRTFIPIRAVVEGIGGTVSWNEGCIQIKVGDRKISMWISRKLYLVNEIFKRNDVCPRIINDRTYVPLRFICENLGYDVNFDNKTNTITINSRIPNDFNFILDYGNQGKNRIDTFNGKCTKDLIMDPSITIDLRFSNEELDLIYSEMKRIDIMNYPDLFKEETGMSQRPFASYRLKIQQNGKIKEIYWEDESASESIKATEMRALFSKIIEIIYSKDVYKKLPVPKGGYL